MFSVIICSVRPGYLEQLKINLAETIGQPYELLAWDNRKEQKGLCEVYNLMASRANFPFLCFMHEDILFGSQNWGTTLLHAFQEDQELGLLGVAGAIYKSKTPSGWSTGLGALDRANIKHKDPMLQTIHIHHNPANARIEHVVTVDGVYLCTRKETWANYPFDESLLKGFHGYDLDFSVRVGLKYRVAVIFDIEIMHLTTGGNFGDEWVDTILRWHKRYASLLPVTLDNTGGKRALERQIRKKCLHRLRTEKISFRNKIRWILQSGSLKHPGTWPFIGIFLFPRVYKAGKTLVRR